jgi:hypothetical protein
MFLDLWSIATLTGDFLDLISDHVEFNFTWSLPFVVFVVSLGFLSTFAWRSTDIPDLPPPPQPPYVIQISGTPSPSNNNGERNALADVRLLSSNSTNAESVFRRIPVNINSQGRVNQPAVIATYRHRFNIASNPILHHNSRTTVRVYPQVQTSQQQQPGQNQNDSSVLLGIIPPRSIAIPVQRNPGGGNQPQNVIVYHRVNVRHGMSFGFCNKIATSYTDTVNILYNRFFGTFLRYIITIFTTPHKQEIPGVRQNHLQLHQHQPSTPHPQPASRQGQYQ